MFGFGTIGMKLAPSNRTLAVLFIAILVVSVVNSVLIAYSAYSVGQQRNKDVSDLNFAISQNFTALTETQYVMQALFNGKIDNLDARLPIGQYDYVVYRVWDYSSNISVYLAKDGRNGTVTFNSTYAADVFNQALSNGNSVYVKSDQYNLTANIELSNKKNARLDSDGAILNLQGHKILIFGDSYAQSQNNHISGLIIVGGTVRVENSFRTTITNLIFENSTVGVELANTNTWTEATKIDNVHFDKCVQGIVFRTNTSSLQGTSTGSYGNTQVSRCYFNQLDNSVALTVEQNAEWTDGQMQNARIWIGESGKFNQTGLLLDVNSSMYQTTLDGVVFESFAQGNLEDAQLYAMKMNLTVYGTPILGAGVSFLGSWTARINNIYNNWILSGGSIFKKENVPVAIGSYDYGNVTIIQMSPQAISSFKPQITVQGSFSQNETVTVRVRLEFVDNSQTAATQAVQKTFTGTGSIWLTDGDLMQLYPSENVVWAILVDAKASAAATDAAVQVGIYGTTT